MTPGIFWDRERELDLIERRLGKGGFGFVTGRRRVGKTALLKKAVSLHGGLYHQGVEGTPLQQLMHLAEEIAPSLPVFQEVVPRTWSEFFSLLGREKLPRLVVLDEFPYWAASDRGLPSLLQKWVDHDLPKLRTLLLVSGSSQAMLHSQFLDHSAPLYGRASLHLHLEPMDYAWFCRALGHDPRAPSSFLRYSLVGGVPHYWKLMADGTPAEQAQALYFDPSAPLAEEPIHLLRDEGVDGALPKAILDLVGRGVQRPGELAARLGTPQGNLSRPLALLLELGLLCRELPFGESLRTTKRVLYSIQDPALLFYYGSFLPNRGRWPTMDGRQREAVLGAHASRCWEQTCRRRTPGASRYWESGVEIDLIAPRAGGSLLVAECKWKTLSTAEEAALLSDLKDRFLRTRLAQRHPDAEFRILSARDLAGS